MAAWSLLLDIVVLLGAALLVGILLERFRQNAVVGYLLTGVLLGPAGFRLVESGEGVRAVADLGVALLLFTIGLEFSWRRLRELGALAAGGGTLQIGLTMLAATLAAMMLGLEQSEALVVGAAVALSSTAVVLRVLTERAELDSMHGRNALGILLLQDIAVVPLLLMISALSEGGGGWRQALAFVVNIGKGCLLVAAMVLLSRYFLPRLLHAASSYRNRDLPILVAITVSLGGAWTSHALGLSPVLGAFMAGMLLAESPFAEQIRADVVPLRAGFVTVFFASIGMLVEMPDPDRLMDVAGLALAIVAGKALIVALVVRLFRQPLGVALASGLALAQIGEFSFVLAELGYTSGLVSGGTFQVLLAASLVTLLMTPYVIAAAPRLIEMLAGAEFAPRAGPPAGAQERKVIVVGFGPAGQAVVSALREAEIPFVVLELNPRTAAAYRAQFPIAIGDATQTEILGHVHPESAQALVVTIPDPHTARLVIRQAKLLAPDLPVVARARHHVLAGGLLDAGADRIVDEEEIVGEQLGARLLGILAEAGSSRQPL